MGHYHCRGMAGSQQGPARLALGRMTPEEQAVSLVFLGCGRFLCTRARRIDCQVLAEELAPLEVRHGPQAVTGPGIETARWLLQCCQRRYEL
jgi:hypothetical protein